MVIVTIDEIKLNSRIDNDIEDGMVEQIGESAEGIIFAIMNRDADDLKEEYGEVPAAVKRAVLMLSDHLYTHRGVLSNVQLYDVPYTFDMMVKPYCKLV